MKGLNKTQNQLKEQARGVVVSIGAGGGAEADSTELIVIDSVVFGGAGCVCILSAIVLS